MGSVSYSVSLFSVTVGFNHETDVIVIGNVWAQLIFPYLSTWSDLFQHKISRKDQEI